MPASQSTQSEKKLIGEEAHRTFEWDGETSRVRVWVSTEAGLPVRFEEELTSHYFLLRIMEPAKYSDWQSGETVPVNVASAPLVNWYPLIVNS